MSALALHDTSAALSCADWDRDMGSADYSAVCVTCECSQRNARERQHKREDRTFGFIYWGTAGIICVAVIVAMTWATSGHL